MEIINQHTAELKKVCERHHVASLHVFGSAASDTMKEDSDIDLLVEFKSVELSDYFDNYLSFKRELEDLFGKKVDLVETQTLKNPILKKAINRGKKLIYEREDTKVVV